MIDQIRKLFSLLSPREKRGAGLLLVLMLVGAGLEVVGVAAIPAFVSVLVEPERLRQDPRVAEVIEWLGVQTPSDFVIWGGIALVAVFAVKNAFLLMLYYLQARYVTNRRLMLSRRMARAYLHAPYQYHLGRNSAEVVRNVNREVAVLSGQVMSALLELSTRLLILAAILVFLFVVEPWVTAFWVAFLGVFGGAGVLAVSGKLKRYGRIEQREGRRLIQGLHQAFGGIKEVKVAGREPFFGDKIHSAVLSVARTTRFKRFTTKAVAPVLEFIAIAGVFALAAWLMLSGRPTDSIIVTLSMFVVGLVRVREALTAAMSHLTNLRYSLVSVEPVHAELQRLEGKASLPAAPAAAELRRQIELRDVWFRYEGQSDYALEGVDLTIAKGSAVGIVGSTGSGKSTLVDILLGLLEPERGGVFVDGVDMREIGVRSWQPIIGYVPQSIYLLDDTIRRNIAFGVADDEIDEAALHRAISAAQLQGFLEEQALGLDTRVGERGVRLSGGQRQRIGIARALYRDPKVLVFDEATSSLDTTTERAVISAMEALRGERTLIKIAHRLTTVRNCDMLHFLKDGRVEASGSFDQLKAHSREFRHMAAG